MVPITPRLRTIFLPPAADVDQDVDVVIGTRELYPTSLIFERSTCFERGIDRALQYHDSLRCIVKPVVGPGQTTRSTIQRQWGMSRTLSINLSPFVLICPEVERPATNPPTTIVDILTPPPWSRDLTVFPKPNLEFVTSADVQKAVARWMKEMTESSGMPGLRATLSKEEKFYLPDGREIDIELWQWKGLRRHGRESDVWDLCL